MGYFCNSVGINFILMDLSGCGLNPSDSISFGKEDS